LTLCDIEETAICQSQAPLPANDEFNSSKNPSPNISILPADHTDHGVDQAKHMLAQGRGGFVDESCELDDVVDQSTDVPFPEGFADELLPLFPVHWNNGAIGFPASISEIAPALAFFVHL
jgi:hypothetical protein